MHEGLHERLREQLTLRILQVGAVAAVLAVSLHYAFELDRFLVPKELVLHLTAALAGITAVRRVALGRVDRLLLLFLLLSGVSAIFATNRWLALRAVAVTASAILVFWAARAVGRPLVNALALAVVIAAATSLLQAYGVRIDLFALNRAPGGTLGNRNFVGHIAAFGLPVVFLAALRARRLWLAGSGVAIVTAALVLTRSRAAWIAAAAAIVIFLAARGGKRMLAIVGSAAAGVVAALLIPNTLHWRSDNPYLESVRRVAGYDAGSGHGRLVQYQRSLLMAARHPLFGVGPGNWPVEYPRYARRDDPSLDQNEGGMTTNPWPSSDWIAFVSERGLAAAIVLMIVLLNMLHFSREAENVAILGTIAAAGLAGLFDAVLLLAVPALLVWATLGALAPPQQSPDLLPLPPKPLAVVALIVVSLIGTARSGAQLYAMNAYVSGSSLESASHVDPGNYRLQLRLARNTRGKRRCEHALAAHALFPNADAARDLARGCN